MAKMSRMGTIFVVLTGGRAGRNRMDENADPPRMGLSDGYCSASRTPE
jgi:hypothetical protein